MGRVECQEMHTVQVGLSGHRTQRCEKLKLQAVKVAEIMQEVNFEYDHGRFTSIL